MLLAAVGETDAAAKEPSKALKTNILCSTNKMDGHATFEAPRVRSYSASRLPLSGRYSCTVCSHSFEDRATLRMHLIEELDIQPEYLVFLDIDLGIDVEEDLSPTSDSTEHSDEPEEIKCYRCGKLCKSVRGLNQHFGKAHSSKKRHAVCKICGKAFRHKYALRFHVKQVHDQATRVACQVCGVVLYNKYMLPKHMRKAHGV